MATIANLAVSITASPAGLMAGLAKTRTALASTAQSAVSTVGRISSSLAGIGSQAAGGDFAGAMRSSIQTTGDLLSHLMNTIPIAGTYMAAGIGAATIAIDALASGLQKVRTLFDEGIGKILSTRAASIEMGVSFQEAGALAMAAGGDVERVTRAMTHLNSTIQGARTGDAGSIALLAGKLRLSAEELAKMGTGQRLEAVIHALGGINDELTKSSVELGIFGERSALAFGPLLKSGNSLDRFREQVKRFGLDMGASSSGEAKVLADQAAEANRAIKQLGLAWDGIKINLAAGLAPTITRLVELFSELGVDAKRIQDWARNGAMILAYAGAAAVETWKQLRNIWDYLTIGFNRMIVGMLEGIQEVGKQLDRLSNSMREFQQNGGGYLQGFAAGVMPMLGLLRRRLESIPKQMGIDVSKELKALRKNIDDTWKQINARKGDKSAFESVTDYFAKMRIEIAEKVKAAEKAEATKKNYEPMRAPIQLAGSAEFGSQEAYKAIGIFLAGQNTSLAQKQLTATQKVEEAVKRGDITQKDIRNILKKGMVKLGRI